MPINPPSHPWNRQQNEPAAEYQLFLAWLRRPPPRHLRSAAAALKCSYHRLRSLCAHYQWRARAEAYDDCRAAAASQKFDGSFSAESADLRRQAELFREQEWILSKLMIAASMEALSKIEKSRRCFSLRDLARMIELASDLGRRACGFIGNQTPQAPQPPYPGIEEALNKIYGKPLPGELPANCQIT